MNTQNNSVEQDTATWSAMSYKEKIDAPKELIARLLSGGTSVDIDAILGPLSIEKVTEVMILVVETLTGKPYLVPERESVTLVPNPAYYKGERFTIGEPFIPSVAKGV